MDGIFSQLFSQLWSTCKAGTTQQMYSADLHSSCWWHWPDKLGRNGHGKEADSVTLGLGRIKSGAESRNCPHTVAPLHGVANLFPSTAATILPKGAAGEIGDNGPEPCGSTHPKTGKQLCTLAINSSGIKYLSHHRVQCHDTNTVISANGSRVSTKLEPYISPQLTGL